MKIKLLLDLPIDGEHQCLQGNVYEVTHIGPKKEGRGGQRRLHYFKSHTTQEKCVAYPEEFETIE